MGNRATEHLKKIQVGDPQSYEHISVFPLCGPDGQAFEYLTMPEALEARVLAIGEVSESGSVPELRVENKADKPVLLLDGEEMIGAKQNRVLNTNEKSYVFDALVERNRETTEADLKPKAQEFLDAAAACEAKDYPSTGYGTDWRFKGEGIVGSALIHDETVVHTAFFRIDARDEAGPMAGYRRRRSHFTR